MISFIWYAEGLDTPPEDMTTDGHNKLQIGLQEHKSEGEADKREGGETRSETTMEKHGNNMAQEREQWKIGEEAFLQQWSEIGETCWYEFTGVELELVFSENGYDSRQEWSK